MDGGIDIDQKPAGSTPADLPATSPPQRLRGHHAAIHAAVTALRAEGKLPLHLRPAQRDKLITKQLINMGYGGDLPSRYAIRRYFQALER